MTDPYKNIQSWLTIPDPTQLLLTRDQQGNCALLAGQFDVGDTKPWVWDSFVFVKEVGLAWQQLCLGKEWLILTSAQSAKFFFEDVDLRWLQGIKIACVGPVTAECVQSYGVNVDLIATEHSAKGLSQEAVFQNSKGLQILHLQPEDGRPDFVEALQHKHQIQIVSHYRKEFLPLPAEILAKLVQQQITIVLFYSPSVVRAFHAAVAGVAGLFESLQFAVIGQSTKDEVESLGGRVQYFPNMPN